MRITSIQPGQFQTVQDWTDAMALDLWSLGAIPRLDNAQDWRAWGANLLNLPSIHGILLPNPYQFDDWRRWAERVVEAFDSTSL